MKIDKAFLATERYSSLIKIQNVSNGNISCLILSLTSVDILYNFKQLSD